MNMTKSNAARYAQLRRDHEITTREALEPLIPLHYFSVEITGNGDYNKTTKVLMATISYLKRLQTQVQANSDNGDNRDKNQVNKEADGQKETPFFISIGMHSNKTQAELIQCLRQVATRLVQKIEESLQGQESPSENLIEVIGKANDLMIDTIAEVERTTSKRKTLS